MTIMMMMMMMMRLLLYPLLLLLFLSSLLYYSGINARRMITKLALLPLQWINNDKQYNECTNLACCWHYYCCHFAYCSMSKHKQHNIVRLTIWNNPKSCQPSCFFTLTTGSYCGQKVVFLRRRRRLTRHNCSLSLLYLSLFFSFLFF